MMFLQNSQIAENMSDVMVMDSRPTLTSLPYALLLLKSHMSLVESTPKLKMFIIQSTVVSMKALISLLISLENLEAVNIVHSIIMDMSSPDEFNFFNIHDMENDLPPSIMEIGYIL